jgi:hypothetical protein
MLQLLQTDAGLSQSEGTAKCTCVEWSDLWSLEGWCHSLNAFSGHSSMAILNRLLAALFPHASINYLVTLTHAKCINISSALVIVNDESNGITVLTSFAECVPFIVGFTSHRSEFEAQTSTSQE